MNAPSLHEIRNGMTARDPADEKMNQVRDLLIGDYVRASEARLDAMEVRMRDLETGITQRLTLLQQRIESLGADHTLDRQAAFEQLGRSVAELGDKIRLIVR